jgi:hypothetical protein
MPDDDEAIVKAVDAFIANEGLEQVESYVKRGRKFDALEIGDLEDRWVAAFKDWAACRSRREPGDPAEMDDAMAEIVLRGGQPPLARVRAEFNALRAAQDERMRDPATLLRMERDVAEQVDAFVEESKGKPPN